MSAADLQNGEDVSPDQQRQQGAPRQGQTNSSNPTAQSRSQPPSSSWISQDNGRSEVAEDLGQRLDEAVSFPVLYTLVHGGNDSEEPEAIIQGNPRASSASFEEGHFSTYV